MASYPKLTEMMANTPAAGSRFVFENQIIPYLVDVWLDDYARAVTQADVVETVVSGFSYLFDVAAGRLIAAWGISEGRHAGARDAARMAGHPLSAGLHFHRGHAIPHSLGGPTDINLVPQRASVNVGPFRVLERRAVANPGSLYFTYWRYGPATDQRPVAVDQGLLVPGHPPEIRVHAN